MKKFFYLLLATILVVSAFMLVSCNGKGEAKKVEQKYFVDGVEIEKIDNGNYIYYIKGEDEKTFYKWDYEANKIADFDESNQHSVYAFSAAKIYNSLEELIADESLALGDKVGVKSYFEGRNSGAGIWTVITDGVTAKGDKKMKNGLYASLVPFEIDGKKIVTVEQFGAKGDGVTADQRFINTAIQKSADIVEFENKEYLQTDTITLNKSNITLDGKGAKISNKYEKGVVNVDLDISGSANNLLKNVTVQNLELYCAEETGKGALYNWNGRNQITANNTDGLTIRNCRIIVPEEGDEPRSNTSIWVNGIVKNLTIENNYIFNYCDNDGGGGIWVSTSAESYDEAASNIVIKNNRVIKNSCDEVFAIFIGYFDGVLVENNYFETRDHFFVTDDMDGGGKNGIGIGVYDCETHCKNVKFLNNEVRLCLTNTAFIFSDCDGVEFAGNKVYVNEGLYGTGMTKKSGINNLFRMLRMDGLTTENCNVVNLNVHDNYFEVTVGKVINRNYDMLCIELGIKSADFVNNEFVINGRLNKILDDKINFTGNKITVNGSLANNNAPEGNTIVVNEK